MRECFVVVREQWCGQGPTEDWVLIAAYTTEADAEVRAKTENEKLKLQPPNLTSNEFIVRETSLEDAELIGEIDRRLGLHDARLKIMSAEGAGGYRLALEELRRALRRVL